MPHSLQETGYLILGLARCIWQHVHDQEPACELLLIGWDVDSAADPATSTAVHSKRPPPPSSSIECEEEEERRKKRAIRFGLLAPHTYGES